MNASLKLLYIDDDPDIRAIVEIALGLDPSIEIRTAVSGADALRLAGQAEWRPDVLVLDIIMPEMDGLATLAALRRLPGLSETPAVFMTASVRDADVARYRAAGAVGVVLKPFDPLLLASEVRALL